MQNFAAGFLYGIRAANLHVRYRSASSTSESQEIYVMDVDGSNVQRLTFNKAFDGHHDW